MKKVLVRDVRVGEFFHLKNSVSSPLWVRGSYERSIRKFSIYKYDDCNHERFLSGLVYVYLEY